MHSQDRKPSISMQMDSVPNGGADRGRRLRENRERPEANRDRN